MIELRFLFFFLKEMGDLNVCHCLTMKTYTCIINLSSVTSVTFICQPTSFVPPRLANALYAEFPAMIPRTVFLLTNMTHYYVHSIIKPQHESTVDLKQEPSPLFLSIREEQVWMAKRQGKKGYLFVISTIYLYHLFYIAFS